jgi:hypothetical protein
MTARQIVESVLRGEGSDIVPFTMYECMIPQCTVERTMRNRGLCIVKRDVPVYEVHRPNVKVTQHVYWEGDVQLTRTSYETPVGTLSTLGQAAGFTTWWHERMFKAPEDYKALLFLIKDEVYTPCYEAFARAQKAFGEDAIFRSGFGLEPLQALISGTLMAMQTFCLEWMDHRDEILKLYSALVEQRRKLYPIVAAAPVLHANYGGNVVPNIIGRETFERYYLPHYHEAAEVMHAYGKYIGCHFDDNNQLIADLIARADLDYIEAFTPAPGSDMTLGQARAAWPDKVLWLNYPSALHLKDDVTVRDATIALLEELSSCQGIIMGITEDMPPERWQGSCQAIMDGLEQHAREHPQKYGR